MAHYSVLVIGNDVETALEPYQQYRSDEPDEYLEFIDRETPLRLEYETDGEDKEVHLPDGKVLSGVDTRFFSLENSKFSYPADAKIVIKRPYREIYPAFEDFVLHMEGLKERNSVKGLYGYWENLNARFEWKQLGGRWRGFFKLKPGASGKLGESSPLHCASEVDNTVADHCAVADIDFDATVKKASTEAGKEWDRLVVQKLPESLLRAFKLFEVSREEYCARAERTCLGTGAVVFDGKWYERGDETLWGVPGGDLPIEAWSAEIAALLKKLPGDTQVSLVDCHY